MIFSRRKLEMPDPATAPQGQPSPILKPTDHYLLSRPLLPPYPAGLEDAIFGLGCFWGAERRFWEVGSGIWITAVGYAGGFTVNPTYDDVCTGRTGHTEVVRVIFDPAQLSYAKLLKTFWEATTQHRATAKVTTSARSIAPRSTPRRKLILQQLMPRGRPMAGTLPNVASTPLRLKSHPRRSSISPKLITSSIWPKSRTATAASREQALPARSRRVANANHGFTASLHSLSESSANAGAVQLVHWQLP